QPRRDEVRDDDLGVALPPEEVEGVEVGVVECSQPAVWGIEAHATPSRRRSRRPTYSSGSTSRTSTSKRRQNACSSALGSGSSAQERDASGRAPHTGVITGRGFP